MVGMNIKNMRNKKNMTQKELAKKLFVTTQAISRWENNKTEPSINSLILLADIFDISLDELLRGKK